MVYDLKNMSFDEVLYQVFFTLFFYEVKLFIPIIYAPFLLWSAFNAHISSRSETSSVSSSRELLIYSSLNIFIMLVWILIFGENHMNHDNPWFPIFDVGAPLGMFSLLVVIPTGLIAASWIGKKRHNLPAENNGYVLASRIFYIISAVPPIWLTLFYSELMFAR